MPARIAYSDDDNELVLDVAGVPALVGQRLERTFTTRFHHPLWTKKAIRVAEEWKGPEELVTTAGYHYTISGSEPERDLQLLLMELDAVFEDHLISAPYILDLPERLRVDNYQALTAPQRTPVRTTRAAFFHHQPENELHLGVRVPRGDGYLREAVQRSYRVPNAQHAWRSHDQDAIGYVVFAERRPTWAHVERTFADVGVRLQPLDGLYDDRSLMERDLLADPKLLPKGFLDRAA